jgi:hypothetical protein
MSVEKLHGSSICMPAKPMEIPEKNVHRATSKRRMPAKTSKHACKLLSKSALSTQKESIWQKNTMESQVPQTVSKQNVSINLLSADKQSNICLQYKTIEKIKTNLRISSFPNRLQRKQKTMRTITEIMEKY